MQGWLRYGVIALICLIMGGGAGVIVGTSSAARDAPFWLESKPGTVPRIQAPNFADLAEHLKPAVVNISTTQVVKGQRRAAPRFPFPSPFGERDPFEEFFERFFGGEGPQREMRRRSLGSGFIVNKDGYIVTNNHVVENASDIKVSLSDKEEFDAKVVGRDPKTDVALIKIDAKKDLPATSLGDSGKLRVGEWVVAIGNPFGLGNTVTVGIVSAKGRIIGAGPYDDFIQTDASINPGNSGGPLFNLHGEVVGINTAIVASGQGIGFAIPINVAKDLLIQLREKGKVTRGWLGVQVQRVTPELAKSFGLDRERGALVADEYDTRAPFLMHNRGLMKESKTIARASFTLRRTASSGLVPGGASPMYPETTSSRKSGWTVRGSRCLCSCHSASRLATPGTSRVITVA